LFRFTRKHRSLFGVENKIFQIENLLDFFRTKSVPFSTSYFVTTLDLEKFRALDKNSLSIYSLQLFNIYV